MPKGPKGKKRSADVVVTIATGEIEEPVEVDDGKDPVAKVG